MPAHCRLRGGADAYVRRGGPELCASDACPETLANRASADQSCVACGPASRGRATMTGELTDAGRPAWARPRFSDYAAADYWLIFVILVPQLLAPATFWFVIQPITWPGVPLNEVAGSKRAAE